MDILIPDAIKNTQQEISDKRHHRFSSAAQEANGIARLKKELYGSHPSIQQPDSESKLYTKPVPPQKQYRNQQTLDSIATANSAAGRVVVRKTKNEFDVHAMRNDWDVAAYDRHNRCPVCNGIPLEDNDIQIGRRRKSSSSKQANSYTLLLTRKLANEQNFVCKNCKKKFKLIKDVRIEGKFGVHWRNELEEM